jgi:flagellar hook-basal body complex protein FliE
MSIEAITPIGGDLSPMKSTAIEPSGNDFMQTFMNTIGKADADLARADQELRAFAAGADIPVHDLMITMERARISLTLMSEVRNRMVEGYQELTRMQL